MGSFSEEEEDCGFFDAQEEIASTSDAGSETVEIFDSNSSFTNWVPAGCPYDVWNRTPGSVKERRVKFLEWMGLSTDRETSVEIASDVAGEVERVRESSGAVLRTTSCVEDEYCLSRSFVSCRRNDYSIYSSIELDWKDDSACRDGNLGKPLECNADEVRLDGKVREGQEVTEESERNSCSSSSLSLQLTENRMEEASNRAGTLKRAKKGWLSRLRSIACLVDRQGEGDELAHDDNAAIMGFRAQRVKVRQCGKRLKELSALYLGQDIQAHEGAILAMKFSPDGQYLASAGEDGIVRVWQVVEDERSNEHDIPEIDPSCIYFTVNHLSELNPLFSEKDTIGKSSSLRKTSDSACVIFPPKVFRILEKPLHEFHGHGGDILDLSWSRSNYLLSSSVDKTVRLWQVGCGSCLKVFSHSNYVTSVQFNPVDENYFISGSIDGKVRIWGISCCQVVDWSDIRDIVTAVCYRPDGQGGIVGSMTGSCRFYNISDNHLQLDAQLCLQSKKKSPCRKITGFQFFPQDSSKVMVTCADSKVRILHGLSVVGKYAGQRNAGNQTSATITSDGKHIVSVNEDSSVYVWNCNNHEERVLSQAKKIRSCERFSTNVSVAIPWSGFKCGTVENERQFQAVDENLPERLPFSSPACFSLSQDSFLQSIPKGSATWPEEKLPTSSPLAKQSTMHKSEYKFLKTSCQNTSSSHAWGMVIVTAGWDGRIRSFHNYGLPVTCLLWFITGCKSNGLTSDITFGSINDHSRVRLTTLAGMCTIDDLENLVLRWAPCQISEVTVTILCPDRWLKFHGCDVIQSGISQWPRLACPDSIIITNVGCFWSAGSQILDVKTSLFSKMMDRDSRAGGWNSFGEKMVGNSTIPSCSPVRMIELLSAISGLSHGRVGELWLAVGMCRNPFRLKLLTASARGWKLKDHPVFRGRHV
ncbi:hypothetical protein ACFX1W_042351 [Malus domestica]